MIITHGVGVSAAFSKYTKVFGSAIDSDRPKKVVIHEISRKRFFLSTVFFSKRSTMNNFLHFLVLLSLVTLSLAFAGGKCGTDRPSPSGSGASGKSIPECGDHECDDPGVR